MADTLMPMQNLGTDNGNRGEKLDPSKRADRKLFMKVSSGEIITAFQRVSVTEGKFMERSISEGKSAGFPVVGRSRAVYLKKGESLDSKRKQIKHSEIVIPVDELLTDDVMIFDLEDAMNSFDVRGIYNTQLGESLAMAKDGAVLAELAIMINEGKENINGLGKPVVVELEANDGTMAGLGTKVIAGFTTARAGLTKNYCPPKDRSAFVSPDTYSAILAALMPDAANYQALINPEDGTISNVMGFTIAETPHLTIGGAGMENPDDESAAPTDQQHAFPTTGTVTDKNVIALFGHRTAVGTVKLKDLQMEMARRPEYQADQMIAKYAMGHKGLRPEAAGALVAKTGE